MRKRDRIALPKLSFILSKEIFESVKFKRMIMYDNGEIKTALFFCRSSVKIYLCRII